MRPLRVVYVFAFALSTLLLLLSVSRHRSRHAYTSRGQSQSAEKASALRTFYSLRSPLFPSSAIISLTDDNSTFFLARPAAFGADLPIDGLSGQLWIGSGFGEDLRGWVGSTNQPEGELGCSDVPGWDEIYTKFGSVTTVGAVKNTLAKTAEDGDDSGKGADYTSRFILGAKTRNTQEEPRTAARNDGTDNYLFQPGKLVSSVSHGDSNADIQSLQESAAITGKVVLLSRGGCGFLDKAKWAQRRGGIALIVGDNMPGGPLVTMYARGDTSNVTIPALFTSHTTAHLLSSLMPLKNGGKTATASMAQTSGKKQKNSSAQKKPGATTDDSYTRDYVGVARGAQQTGGIFRSVASLLGSNAKDDRERLNGHEKNDWVIVEDWQSEDITRSRAQHKAGAFAESKLSPARPTRGAQIPVSTGSAHDSDQSTTKDASQVGEKSSTSVDSILDNEAKAHEGLWVTLTPASMSSSPFFDTILVLVISPLVTLSVVYAILLVRSRIRRRRWRAPKSVVDRLPVRTYQTIPSSGASTRALATPLDTSPNTPLLQSSADSDAPLSRSASRQRPRSRTTSDLPGPSTQSSDADDDDDDDLALTESAKREKSLATWRRRYGGRQKECVVCIEEYVSGVSRVMSLPCGHEFHVECITPWLTTRRRTCPICKGDVVRSMTLQDANEQFERASAALTAAAAAAAAAGASSSSTAATTTTTARSRTGARPDDGALQARVASARNDSPSAHEPVPLFDSDDDVERAQYAVVGGRARALRGWAVNLWQRYRPAVGAPAGGVGGERRDAARGRAAVRAGGEYRDDEDGRPDRDR